MQHHRFFAGLQFVASTVEQHDMDQTKIWDHFQNCEASGDIFASARPRYELLARRIAPGMRVLNIGVGRGGLEALLQKKGAIVSCLDPSEAAIDRLRKEYALGESAKVGFSQAMPFPDSQFDVVVMSEVLEHLANDILTATLAEVRRVLKKDGKFIGTVPADENLADNHVMCPHCGQSFHRWGHLQSFSEGRLCKMLAEQFKNVNVFRHFLGDPRALNWKGMIVWAFKKMAVSLGIKGSGESFSFSASNC